MVDWSQESDGWHDVYGGDDKLLNAEACKLDAFHDVEFGRPIVGHGRVAPVRKDDRWDVQGAGIKDDHAEHISKSPLIADHEMKARVEHKGLPRNHCNPS